MGSQKIVRCYKSSEALQCYSTLSTLKSFGKFQATSLVSHAVSGHRTDKSYRTSSGLITVKGLCTYVHEVEAEEDADGDDDQSYDERAAQEKIHKEKIKHY